MYSVLLASQNELNGFTTVEGMHEFFSVMGSIVNRAWNVLATLRIFGVSFTTWIISFFLISLAILAVKLISTAPVGASDVVSKFKSKE